MKFDSYPRFLKSELYKECVVRVLAGEELSLPSNNAGLHLNLSQRHFKVNMVYFFCFSFLKYKLNFKYIHFTFSNCLL